MINAKTKLCGIIGNPVEHSLSPAMHNAAFSDLGLNYVYLAFRVDDVGDVIKGMKSLNIIGLNVTIPHKIGVMKYLDEIDETAEKIGAVNTIFNDAGNLKGFNTDWKGAIRSVKEQTSIRDKRAVILGAGGAARAIVFGIKREQGELTILNRTVEKAEKLSKEIGCNFGPLDELKNIQGDILINTTSVGMYPNESNSLVEKDVLRNFDVVFDIVYNPMRTKLLKDAESVGCKTISGVDMVVLQGVEAFELWTGKKPNVKLMKKVVIEKLNER